MNMKLDLNELELMEKDDLNDISSSMIGENIPVEDFVNMEYRNYSLYSIYNRAIPSVVDGLKPAQRKIVWTANKTAKEQKKTSALAGDVVSHANYHHGSSSLEGGIVVLTRKDNNLPILDGKGYFGNRVVPKAAHARYTKSKRSPIFKKYFLDNEICPLSDDPDSPEPAHFLPLIPWVLVNGIQGIAVGFASTIQPRDPDLLRKGCMAHLMGKDISTIDFPPFYRGFKGEIVKTMNKDVEQWKARGIVEHRKGVIYDIKELPVCEKAKDRIAYVTILNDLRRIGAIVDYKDRCSKEGFHFELKLRHKPLSESACRVILRNEVRTLWQSKSKKYTQEKFDKEVEKLLPKRIKMLETYAIMGRNPDEVIISLMNSMSLVENLNDNLTTLDETGKLKIFDTVQDVIKHFTDYRLSQYTRRYEYYIQRDADKLKLVKTKYGFIRSVMADKIVLKGKKRADGIALLTKLGIDDETANTLLRMPISSFCSDELDKLREEATTLTTQINVWKQTDPKRAYLEDLKGIK